MSLMQAAFARQGAASFSDLGRVRGAPVGVKRELDRQDTAHVKALDAIRNGVPAETVNAKLRELGLPPLSSTALHYATSLAQAKGVG
jgi:hypothetical protein